MNTPDDLKYSKEHEWVRIEDNFATIGVTDYAQEQLGDIVYVELPNVGDPLKCSETFGVLESVKAVSDCYAPISGKIIEVNDDLNDNPEQINQDSYGEGWMIKVELSNKSEADKLMSHAAYQAYLTEESA